MLQAIQEHLLRVLRTSRELGATAVEYALMVAAIAAVVGAVAFTLGHTASSSLSKTNACIQSGATSNC